MQVELKSGLLSLRLNAGLTFTRLDLWLGLSYCDGKWNKVLLKKAGPVVSASVNELTERVSESRAQPLTVNSPVYMGGAPSWLQGSYKHLTLEPGKCPLEESPNHVSPGLNQVLVALCFKIQQKSQATSNIHPPLCCRILSS